jgi:hypothetical protein
MGSSTTDSGAAASTGAADTGGSYQQAGERG